MSDNVKAAGSFRFTCEVSGTIALSRITAGWTEDEIEGLLRGDFEAVEEAVSRAQRDFDSELDWETTRAVVSGRLVSAADGEDRPDE